MGLFEKLVNAIKFMNKKDKYDEDNSAARNVIGCLSIIIMFFICLIPTYFAFAFFMDNVNPFEWATSTGNLTWPRVLYLTANSILTIGAVMFLFDNGKD